MSISLQKMSLETKPEVFPSVLHYSPVQILAADGLEGENAIPVGTGISYDLSRRGMRLFTTLPIDHPQIEIRFLTPSGADVTRAVRVVDVQHRNDWVWINQLEFETDLPESEL